ncbi:ABC transporter ATP-binding protein [uncultured Roseivirga sp.]|uniref:ATP-binding cassette domain-containing protein n=1 Tax=uncultured Roseivirga sp. TaxID=543088 RepID=UPI00258E63BA|nr:ABC transporter ATP-binding protein [uncultured Roseivirga sp.]
MNSFVFLSIIALLFYQIGVDFIYVFGVIGITFFVVLTLLQKASRIIGNKAMKFRESYSMFINQFLNGILELRLFKRSRFFLEIAQKRTSELSSAEIKRDFYSTLAKPIIEIVFISFLIITLAIELRTNDPVETIANFSLYLVAVYKLIPSINEIIGAATSIRFYAKSLSIVNSYLQKNNESNESESVYTYEELEEGKLIEFRDVTFGYDATKPIIKNLNLEVNRGDIIGISGPSGSGKSTMIMLFSGLFRPQKGQIVFNAKVFKEDVKFGYVSQKPFIFNQNLLKNISLTNDDSNADLDRVKESIKKAQLDIFTDEELSTKDLGENGAVLSGGQRQRVSIARAMYPDKEILIIDEATASLDRVTAQNILRAILYDGQLATLMITHRQEDLNFANKKLVFTDNDIKIEVND